MLIVIFSLALSFCGSAFAQSGGIAEARLISRSTSGQTILLNIGEFDHIKAGDQAVLMRRILPQEGEGMRVIPIAQGKIIRVGRARSLWLLTQIKDPTLLILRENYLVTTETMVMNGRRRLENERKLIVDKKENIPSTLKETQNGDKDLLSLRKEDYLSLKQNHKLGEKWNKDGALHDIDEWVSSDKNGQQKYARSLWRSSSEKDFADQKRLETFNKIVANYLTRINDPSFNYNDFYWEQTRDVSGQFRLHSNSVTEHQKFLAQEQTRMGKDAELYKELLDKGQAWSSDYSDEELRTLLDKVGVIYEQDRRRTITVRSYSWQVMGSFGFNLLDNENRADSTNARKAKWSLEGGGEWFPVPKHDQFQKLSLWSSLRYAEDGVSIGQLNANSQEYSFGLGSAWHLVSPFAIGQNIPFVAVGVRMGVVQLSTPSNGDQANYSLLSFPVLSGGVKYSFRSGVGLRVAASVEKLLLEQTETNQIGVELPAREEILEGRLNIGLTKLY